MTNYGNTSTPGIANLHIYGVSPRPSAEGRKTSGLHRSANSLLAIVGECLQWATDVVGAYMDAPIYRMRSRQYSGNWNELHVVE
jgi:hypothetical protein